MLIMIILCLMDLSGSAAGAQRVACLGDSDTYGYGLPDRLNNCYPVQLERILKEVDSCWETRNFGVNGATVLKRGDISYRNQSAYHQALEYEPDVVVFHFGGNASRPPNRPQISQFYVTDYNTLIDSFAQLPNKPKILICQTKGIFTTAFDNAQQVITEQLVPLIPEIASARGLPLIDFYSVFSKSPELYQSDGIHLNIEGTALMAEMVAAVILGRAGEPDLNGDGKVDSVDVCIMIDYWGTDEPSCDIAPPPFGDGIIDVQDLVILTEYLFQDVNDRTLEAHWALDETEGLYAIDSVGNNHAVVLGGFEWQPTGGQIDGALKLDGLSGYAIAGAVLDPADGPFSVLAWVKGGAEGQAVISEPSSINWLSLDLSEGHLMTELTGPGRSAGPLFSETSITDGEWHHIGFVWDGSKRTLYVDSIEVAQDTQEGLISSSNGLFIGTGKAMATGTYWTGLIDDIRIYSRVVRP